jgi:hypothetical protein
MSELIRLGETIDSSSSGARVSVNVFRINTSHEVLRLARLVDKDGRGLCKHVFTEVELVGYLQKKDHHESLCPMCNGNMIDAGSGKRRRDQTDSEEEEEKDSEEEEEEEEEAKEDEDEEEEEEEEAKEEEEEEEEEAEEEEEQEEEEEEEAEEIEESDVDSDDEEEKKGNDEEEEEEEKGTGDEKETDDARMEWTVEENSFYTDGNAVVSKGTLYKLINFCGKELHSYGINALGHLNEFNKRVRLVLAFKERKSKTEVEEIAGFVLYRHNIVKGDDDIDKKEIGEEDLKRFIYDSLILEEMYKGSYEDASDWLDSCVNVIQARNRKNNGPYSDVNDVPQRLFQECYDILSASLSYKDGYLINQLRKYVEFLMELDEGDMTGTRSVNTPSDFPVVVPRPDEAQAFVILVCTNPGIRRVGVARYLLKHIEEYLFLTAKKYKKRYKMVRISLKSASDYSTQVYKSIGFYEIGHPDNPKMITRNLKKEKNRLDVTGGVVRHEKKKRK